MKRKGYDTLTKHSDGEWDGTLVRHRKTGKIAAFGKKGAAFESNGSTSIYGPKSEGKRTLVEKRKEGFLSSLFHKFLG